MNTSNQFEQQAALHNMRRIDPATVQPHTPTVTADEDDMYEATVFECVCISAVISVLSIAIFSAVLWSAR